MSDIWHKICQIAWPWIVRHSIMLKVTWRRFDQSAKQLVVGRTTMYYVQICVFTVLLANKLINWLIDWHGSLDPYRKHHMDYSFMPFPMIFTARCYTSAVLAIALCLSVRPSVTSRCSTKTAKGRITKITSHDSPGTLVFWRQRSPRNSTGVTPYGGTKMQVWWVNIGDFRQITGYISKTVYKIDAWFLLKWNMKSYALYRTVALPMTLSAI